MSVASNSREPDMSEGGGWSLRAIGTAPPPASVRHYLLPPMGGPLLLAARAAPYVVGRDDACDLVIASANVSRRHCELVVQDARATVRDLDARNGTYVNNV